jgi:hypothetical protein
MKKILFSIALLCGIVSVFATANRVVGNGGITPKAQPTGTLVYKLHSPQTNESKDTIAAGDMSWYGPYALVADPGEPIPASIVVVGDAITGTTPVASVDFQVINGLYLSDTTSTWTPACSLGTTPITKPFSLSTFAGKSIVFRVNNYDGSADQIPGRLSIIIRSALSHYKMH